MYRVLSPQTRLITVRREPYHSSGRNILGIVLEWKRGFSKSQFSNHSQRENRRSLLHTQRSTISDIDISQAIDVTNDSRSCQRYERYFKPSESTLRAIHAIAVLITRTQL
ncbi:hypothetical protein Tcan_17264 [Toxocara canis]|uniref:Uncharacterized protein n=1 Tax=Toxocara canis TaxID=6265 RepID=A0A0B2V146_TOXCA|nr:hypothetical protein Tcan_17264 [Toxocara canis]